MAGVGALWGVGSVLGGAAGVVADVDQDDGFQDEVVVVASLDNSVEQGGCAVGSRG